MRNEGRCSLKRVYVKESSVCKEIGRSVVLATMLHQEMNWGVSFVQAFEEILIRVASRRGYVLRNALLCDFVVVRTCTYTNLDSTV